MNVRPIEIEETLTVAAGAAGIIVPGDVDNITIVAESGTDAGNVTISVTNSKAAAHDTGNVWVTLVAAFDVDSGVNSAINLDLPNKGRFAQYKLTHSGNVIAVYRVLKYRTPRA